MVSHIPPLPPFLTPQEWEFFLAWLSHQFCSSCAHSQTYWHVISVFLVIHLVLVDNGPIHQALTGLSCSSLTSSLIFFHSSRTFVPIAFVPIVFTYFYYALHCQCSIQNATSIYFLLFLSSLSSASPCLCPCYCVFPLSNVLAILAQSVALTLCLYFHLTKTLTSPLSFHSHFHLCSFWWTVNYDAPICRFLLVAAAEKYGNTWLKMYLKIREAWVWI